MTFQRVDNSQLSRHFSHGVVVMLYQNNNNNNNNNNKNNNNNHDDDDKSLTENFIFCAVIILKLLTSSFYIGLFLFVFRLFESKQLPCLPVSILVLLVATSLKMWQAKLMFEFNIKHLLLTLGLPYDGYIKMDNHF